MGGTPHNSPELATEDIWLYLRLHAQQDFRRDSPLGTLETKLMEGVRASIFALPQLSSSEL